MQRINVPRANSNDGNCLLLEWLYENGQEVQAGNVLAYLETSKATVDVLSPGTGILHRLGEPGEEYAPGSCIGYVLASEEEREAFPARGSGQAIEQESSLILTRDAQELVTRHGVTEAQLHSIGKKLLRKADVMALLNLQVLEGRAVQTTQRLRNQAIIAKRVIIAHQTIPSAFAAIRVYCDGALKAITKYIEKEGVVIGLAEVLIKDLGEMHREYPCFYQDREPGGEGGLNCVENPGIGITIDVGTGLYIPVVKEAATKSLAEIANEMMEFRLKALRRIFKEEELREGHITISLHSGKDLIVAVPIIFPTQTCILSLCSEQEELYLDADGRVRVRRYLHLGIAYDHRVINGAEAVQFLQEIKRRFESLEEGKL